MPKSIAERPPRKWSQIGSRVWVIGGRGQSEFLLWSVEWGVKTDNSVDCVFKVFLFCVASPRKAKHWKEYKRELKNQSTEQKIQSLPPENPWNSGFSKVVCCSQEGHWASQPLPRRSKVSAGRSALWEKCASCPEPQKYGRQVFLWQPGAHTIWLPAYSGKRGLWVWVPKPSHQLGIPLWWVPSFGHFQVLFGESQGDSFVNVRHLVKELRGIPTNSFWSV